MKIKFKATDIELTPELTTYVKKRIADVEKFVHAKDPESVSAYVELERTTEHHQAGKIMRAEVNLRVDGAYFRAEFSDEEIYAAIDSVKDELIRLARSYYSKQRTLIRKGGVAIKKILRGFYRT